MPSTLAEDGDALNVMILMDEPAHVGCVLQIRLIGVIEAEQIEKGKTIKNDRHAYIHEDFRPLQN